MEAVIHNLKAKEILTEKNISALRQYIANKYHNYSQDKRAAVFADAVHQIIDRHIGQFNEGDRYAIRINVLKAALKENNSTIDGHKILDACIQLNRDDTEFIDSLAQWLNENQSVKVDNQELTYFVKKIHSEYSKVKNFNLEIQPDYPGDNIASNGEMALSQVVTQESTYTKNYDIEETIKSIIEKGLRYKEYIIQWMNQVVVVLKPIKLKELINKPVMLLTYSIVFLVFCYSLVYQNYSSLEIGLKASSTYPVSNTNAVNGEESDAEVIYQVLIQQRMENNLPPELQYVEINELKLRQWLNNRKALLANDPYFSAIMDAAREYNINPFLLFAITGQEQSFVPKTWPNSKLIANNPFNVFGSWVKYNTNIYDSSSIAAKTVVNLSKGRPDNVDAIRWINRRYAEDDEWWIGVKAIFQRLNKEVGTMGISNRDLID